jgi:hypothetical protein
MVYEDCVGYVCSDGFGYSFFLLFGSLVAVGELLGSSFLCRQQLRRMETILFSFEAI